MAEHLLACYSLTPMTPTGDNLPGWLAQTSGWYTGG